MEETVAIHFSVQTLVAKVAYENGWEVAVSEPRPMDGASDALSYRSARHAGTLTLGEAAEGLLVELANATTQSRLLEAFPGHAAGGRLRLPYAPPAIAEHLPLLAGVFRTAAELEFEHQLNYLSTADGARTTERAAEVAQRVGQDIFRAGLFELWGGACAVTGLSQAPLLRASHAKPWADATDEERLDPYNGFLLAPHLDALFDAGLVSFADDGAILFSPQLAPDTLDILALVPALHLRLPPSPRHLPYLAYHRNHVFKKP